MRKLTILVYILLILMIPLVSATDWDIVSYYRFDNDLTDSEGDNDMIGSTHGFSTNAKIGSHSVDTNGGGDVLNETFGELDQVQTVSFWFNGTTLPTDKGLIAIGTTFPDGLHIYIDGSGNLDVLFWTGGTTYCEKDIATPSANVYHNLVFQSNTSNCQIWYDGEMVENDSSTVVFQAAWTDVHLGGDGGGLGHIDSRIDNLLFSGNYWDSNMVSEQYNSGDGIDFDPPVLATGQLNILFQNRTGGYETTYDEGENFHVLLNYTDSINNSAIGNGFCDIALTEGLGEIDIAESSNFTLCASGCNNQTYKTPLSIEKDNGTENILHFDVCHEQLAEANLLINISCGDDSYFESVTPIAYPICSLGTGKLFISTSICSFNETLNISISTDANNSQRKQISEIEFDREYSVDINHNGTDVKFNASSGFYYIDTHTHEYYKHGLKNITADCQNADSNLNINATAQITIVNIPPEIFIEEFISPSGIIYAAIEGVILAYELGTWLVEIAVVDDDFEVVNATLYNSTGDSLLSIQTSAVSSGQLPVSSDLLRDFNQQPFNLTVWANDTALDQSVLGLTFNLSDTADPVCLGFVNDTSTILNNSLYTFNAQCSDESFFSLNVSCDNGFENATEGLNVKNWNFTPSILINDSVTCSIEYCDGHTAKDVVIDAYSTSKEAVFDSKIILSSDISAKKFEFNHKSDRVEFTFKPNKATDRLNFTVTSDDKIFIMDSIDYPAHIVTGEYWIDFDHDDIIYWRVSRLSETSVFVELLFSEPSKNFKFKSIGKTNCINSAVNFQGQVSFTSVGETEDKAVEFSSIPQALFWIFLTMFWFIVMIAALKLKGIHGDRMGVMIILQSILGLVVAIGWIQNFSFMIGMGIMGVTLIVLFGGWN